MKLTWYGHSCFTIEDGGYRAVLDPFAPGSVPGLPDIHVEADAVFCSHGHSDHNYTAAVKIKQSGGKPFGVTELQTYHDDQKGALRGRNTVRIFDVGGLKAVHLGDLGHFLPDDDIKVLSRADVLMIPVGGHYTIGSADAARLTKAIKPRVVVPMHYHGDGFGFAVLSPLSDFTSKLRGYDIIEYETNTMDIDAGTPPQVAVLRCPAKR